MPPDRPHLAALALSLVALACGAPEDGGALDTPPSAADAGESRDAEPLPPDLGPPPDAGVDAGPRPAPSCTPSFEEHNDFRTGTPPPTAALPAFHAGDLLVSGFVPVTFTSQGESVDALSPALHLVAGGPAFPPTRTRLAGHPADEVLAVFGRSDAVFTVATGGTARAPEARGTHVVRFESGDRNPTHSTWQGLGRGARLWAVATATSGVTLVTGAIERPARLRLDRLAPGDDGVPGEDEIEVALGDGPPAEHVAAASVPGGLVLATVQDSLLVLRGVRFSDGAVTFHGTVPGFSATDALQIARTRDRLIVVAAGTDGLRLVSLPFEGPYDSPPILDLPAVSGPVRVAARPDRVALAELDAATGEVSVTVWSPALEPLADVPYRPRLRGPAVGGATVVGHGLAAGDDEWALAVTYSVPGAPASAHHAVVRFGDCGL